MIKNKTFALIFRIAALCFSLAGIFSVIGVFDGKFNPDSLYFYTTQSNILAVIMFFLLTVSTVKGIRNNDDNAGYFPRFSMVCVIDIMITFLVYWILLAPTLEGWNQWAFSNLSVHAVTPVLCLVDYILFTQSRHLKYRNIYAVVVYPVLYVAFASIIGFAGAATYGTGSDGAPLRFPYFFFDYDRIGVWSAVYIGALIIVFLLISHVFYLFDSKIRKA